jgi:GDP-4-dehydro-6-deoxy-D-mannose reductase
VQAYVDLVEKGDVGEVYNAGSGRSIKIEDILNKLLSFSEKEIRVEEDPTLLRPIVVPELVCDNTKIRNATGWQPKIDIDTTLKETLEYFRSQE